MKKLVAITGGIGSGKSFVCQLLRQRGICVYDCDAAAKRLMATDGGLQRALIRLVGEEVYADGKLQKAVLARYLLQSEAHKLAVDDVVHPAVARDFLASGMQWLESAILFDSGFDQRVNFDFKVCVSAPLEVRIARVMQRDHISREKTLEWIGRQLSQEEVERRSDAVIINDGRADLDVQITRLLSQV
jgi:dephospho-CoA kinase